MEFRSYPINFLSCDNKPQAGAIWFCMFRVPSLNVYHQALHIVEEVRYF
jgi:hypothetical protein